MRTIFPVIISTNSEKSMLPDSSLSMSEIIFRTSAFFTVNPSARMAAFSSFTSMDPDTPPPRHVVTWGGHTHVTTTSQQLTGAVGVEEVERLPDLRQLLVVQLL
jgi:hypothetical protein